ncbi:substrate-binding domain-containing protein [Nocardioides sp.]|uniref:substrate-binding domain-containing protein n=1 Tax=Nocardioides sp. TaxID=35761 RepID=UPI0035192B0C
MNRFLTRTVAAAAAITTLSVAAAGVASADPDNAQPGTPPAGKTASQIYATVGADAFAELTSNIATVYNAQTPAPTRVLASYDAVNPTTAAAQETIVTKPGCSITRPNGANAAISAITLNQKSTVDTNEFCIDWVRASRAKGAAPAEQNLTFYAQSRDAVSYAVIGNAYAPTTPLTTAQLKDIFECTVSDWSEVGGQAGEIHVYLPAASAATLTFFLQALGTNLTNVNAGCAGLPRVYTNQQNDGRSLNGDPQGIAPYTVTKWAAQGNGAPGIPDYRGGAHIGTVNTDAAPTIATTFGGRSYQVLNPAFTTGASASFGRLFFNAVRNDAPQELKDLFKAGGYLCQNQDAFLVPFGNTPLGNDTTQSRFCGQAS